MFKTGNNFIDACLTAVRLIPLLPVILIFIKKGYLKEQMNFLMIVCLLNFLSGVLRQTAMLTPADRSIINNIFSLLELIFIILLFRPILNLKIKNGVNLFMIVFLSVVLTSFSLKGWSFSSVTLDILEGCIVLGIILLSLPPLIRTTNPYILQSPLLWIAGGTLFYFFTFILLEGVGGSCMLPVSHSPDTEKMILLAIAGCIRYFLYTGAILMV
jgi:hypothetical protein